jgi:RimJ/RimL family protein N-acetyltransferase
VQADKEMDVIEGVQLAYGCDEMVRQWVARELNQPITGECRAIGGVLDGRMIGGLVFHNYKGFMVEVTMATNDKRWCNRRVLRAGFQYAFEHLGVDRINMVCSKKNKLIRKLAKGLGFKQEGCHRKAFDGKVDAISYGLLKDECRWL